MSIGKSQYFYKKELFLIGSRINTIFELLKAKKIVKTRKEFCELLGIDYKTLAKYVDGRVGFSVNSENFDKFKKAGVNLNWLLTGDGEPFLADEKKETEKSILEQAIEKMIEEKTEERLAMVEKKQSEFAEEITEIKKVIRKVTVRTMGSDGTVYESIEDRDEDNNTINKKPIKSSKPLYPGVVPADDVFGVEEPSVAYGKEIELPLIENLAAGIPVESYHDHDTFAVSASLVKGKKEDYCVAKISGTSMTDAHIYDGSFVLLKICTMPQNGAISVVQYENETTLKLLQQKEDCSWELKYCDGSNKTIAVKAGTWLVKARYITTLKK